MARRPGLRKARDIVDIDAEARPPFQIVLREPLCDPLDVEAEPVNCPKSKLPTLPAEMAEIGFDLNLKDLDS